MLGRAAAAWRWRSPIGARECWSLERRIWPNSIQTLCAVDVARALKPQIPSGAFRWSLHEQTPRMWVSFVFLAKDLGTPADSHSLPLSLPLSLSVSHSFSRSPILPALFCCGTQTSRTTVVQSISISLFCCSRVFLSVLSFFSQPIIFAGGLHSCLCDDSRSGASPLPLRINPRHAGGSRR